MVIWKIGQTINDTTYAKTNHKYFDATIVFSIRRSNNALKIGSIGVFELKINFIFPNILSLISIFFFSIHSLRLQFSYDVKAGVMGLGPTITVDGTVVETILAGEFSIALNDTNFNLDDLKILSLGHIRVQLTSGNLLRTVSGPFLTIITQLFRAKISTSASDGIKDYVGDLINYANKIDLFELKKFIQILLGNVKAKNQI